MYVIYMSIYKNYPLLKISLSTWPIHESGICFSKNLVRFFIKEWNLLWPTKFA